MVLKSKILTLIFICAIGINTGFFYDYQVNSIEFSHQINADPKNSASHPTIELLSNVEVDNFCAGNGTDGLTSETAHVIQDLQMNAAGSGNVVFLENVDRYVIFRNCTIINAGIASFDAGVKLIRCSHIIVENCTIRQNGAYGMYLLNCIYIAIDDSNLSLNGVSGIYFESTISSSVSNSELSLNEIGVEAGEGSNNLEIIDNSIVDNLYYGIYLDRSSYSRISSNHILGANDFGIYLEFSTDDLIFNNTVFGAADRGITIYESNKTIVSYNDVQSCSYGLEMWGGDSGNYNLIEQNNFSNNTILGIILDDKCQHNQILNNLMSSNNDNGLYLTDRIFNTTLENNVIENNGGIAILIDQDSSNILIHYNTIRDNPSDYAMHLSDTVNTSIFKNIIENNYGGLDMQSAHNNTVFGNSIVNNTFEGIYVGGSQSNRFAGNNVSLNDNGLYIGDISSNNTIWMNILNDNTGLDGFDATGDNSWDNGDVGNYWGDYQDRYPFAVAQDNIWSIEYEVNASGGETNVNDTLPLVSTTTFLEIVSGDDFKYVYGETGKEIQWNVTGSMSIMPQYRIFLEGILIQQGNWNGETIVFNVDGLPVGTYDYLIVVTDGTAWKEIQDIVHVEVGLLPGKPVFITESQTYEFLDDGEGFPMGDIFLRWEEVPNADSYDVYLDGDFWTNTVNPNLWCGFSDSTRSFHIVARNEFGESEPSATIVIIFKLLPSDNSGFIFVVVGGALFLITLGVGYKIVMKKEKKT
jgi:parallel beta-helix repeat protein